MDYLLYVDLQAVGVIKAKPEGTPLSGVEWQSAMCAEGLDEQERTIATASERLAAVRRLTDGLNAARAHQTGLRRSLLAAAFSGRLTGATFASDLEQEERL